MLDYFDGIPQRCYNRELPFVRVIERERSNTCVHLARHRPKDKLVERARRVHPKQPATETVQRSRE